MHLASPHMAQLIGALYKQGKRYDALFTSGYLDVAVLRSLLARVGIFLPIGLYFHENQFAYPDRGDFASRSCYAAINYTSALCADKVAFNSAYNRDTFFHGVYSYLKKNRDFQMEEQIDLLQKSCSILRPGMDFGPNPDWASKDTQHPVILWNHRWEHDKNPEEFFTALFRLAAREIPFKLIVLGQSFRKRPPVFEQAIQTLGARVIHFGYVSSRDQYLALLEQGTVAVSTARHEFFGFSMLEAVRAGCRPLVPDRLAYPELFGKEYRYSQEKLEQALAKLLLSGVSFSQQEAMALTEPYSWTNLACAYEQWFDELLHGKVPGHHSAPGCRRVGN